MHREMYVDGYHYDSPCFLIVEYQIERSSVVAEAIKHEELARELAVRKAMMKYRFIRNRRNGCGADI